MPGATASLVLTTKPSEAQKSLQFGELYLHDDVIMVQQSKSLGVASLVQEEHAARQQAEQYAADLRGLLQQQLAHFTQQ